VHSRQRAGDDGEGGYDDLVARPQIERRHGELQRGRSVAHRDAVALTAVRRPLLLEVVDEPAGGGDPSGANALGDVVEIRLAEQRLVEGYHCQRPRRAGQNRSFSSWPVYGPCFTSRKTVSSSM